MIEENLTEEIAEDVEDLGPAGMPHGTVIETPPGDANEIIVHEYDEDGKVIGWHKEVANG